MMNVSNIEKRELLSRISDSIKPNEQEEDNLEFECIVHPRKVTKQQFQDLITYCRSDQLKMDVVDMLSISFVYNYKNYRINIIGTPNISVYCKNNDVIDIPHQSMEFVVKTQIPDKKSVFINEYDIKFNLKKEYHERDESVISAIKKQLPKIPKTFRLKKRISFVLPQEPLRYDFTLVKSSLESSLNFHSSGTSTNTETFEVEIELDNDRARSYGDVGKILNSMLSSCALLSCILRDEDVLIGQKESMRVIEDYMRLYSKLNDTKITKFSKPMFVGPMPVTLEKRNLSKDATTSILNGYTVTEKADGDRKLLFFDSSGHGYFIDRNINVSKTGMHNALLASTLLDGELIKERYDGKKMDTKIYAIFDVYFYKGRSVCSLPLVQEVPKEGKSQDNQLDDKCRLYIIQEISKVKLQTSSESAKHTFTMMAKTFLYSDEDFLKRCAKILEKYALHQNIQYKTDGLIFTPKDLGVGAIFKDGKPKLGASWNKVFKWKPPSDNSIDFLVKIKKDLNGQAIMHVMDDDTNDEYVCLDLYISYDIISSVKKLDIDTFTRIYEDFVKQQRTNPDNKPERRELRQFLPNVPNASFSLVKKDRGAIKCENGDVIYDGFVVEFAFKDDKWMPLRVRRDKTVPNAYHTAINVWNSMTDMITEGMISGTEAANVPIEATTGIDEDMYYNRVEDRNESLLKPMLDFHNSWVKRISLLDKFKGKASSVLDMACGKGNDLQKILSAKFTKIIGLDKSEDNIFNPKDGAYSRVLFYLTKNSMITHKHDITYLPMDCSKVLDDEYISTIKDTSIQQAAQKLWSSDKGVLLKHGVDVVLCNFAIHYFFASKQSLDNFFKNVSNALKPKGYFIGTCLDGLEIHNFFKRTGENKIERTTTFDRILWSLEKKYDDFDTSNPDKNYGLSLDVYIETINQVITEYLVDFKLLAKKAQQYGMRLLTQDEMKFLGITNMPESTSTFDKLFDVMQQKHRNIAEPYAPIKSALSMDEKLKEYSFKNRWFVFVRDVV